MRVIAVFALFLASSGTVGCGRREETPAELGAEVATRRSPILAEIAALGADHPWAGEYSTAPDFAGTTVLLAPTSGCLAYDHGCLGVYSMNWGSVVVRDGRVHVSFAEHGSGTWPRAFEHEYTIEGTGALRCLMPVRNDAYGERLCLDWRKK